MPKCASEELLNFLQFIYGEDGLDVCKSQYLKEKQLSFLEETVKSLEDDKFFKRIKKLGDRKMISVRKAEVHTHVFNILLR